MASAGDAGCSLRMELLEKIGDRRALVGVVGLGYVGLPLATLFASEGFRVLGFDTDPEKVARLNVGESYIGQIPASMLEQVVTKGKFTATGDLTRLGEPDAILICVPTPLTDSRDPDLGYVRRTAEAVARSLRRAQLVVLESTTYPGTTSEVVKPILESTELRCGEDFFLAYSPEREDPGNREFSTRTIPKVVGGVTADCLEICAALYGSVVCEIIQASSPEVAEAAKQLENVFRAVNVGLVNELKVLFHRMGIDIWEVVDTASTKPFGFMRFTPGPGLGGHCLPVDPFYLTWRARQYNVATRFIELAGEINASMPRYVALRTAEALNELGKCVRGARILVLGVAYKADIDDTRESPGLEIIALLQQQGAKVSYNDPYVPRLRPTRRWSLDLASQGLTAEVVSRADCVLIVTAHSQYDWDLIVENASLVVDTRNATRGVSRDRDKIRFA